MWLTHLFSAQIASPLKSLLSPSLVANMLGNFMETARQILKDRNPTDLEIFLAVVWSFWYRRNKWIHEKEHIYTSTTAEYVLSLLQFFKELKTSPSTI